MFDATPFLRLYAGHRARRLALEDGAQVQERTLLKLVRRAADTRFGKEHGFREIEDVAGFRERVPLRRYEDFWSVYWQPSFPRLTDNTWPGTIPFFAVTSGTTTGATKYIPCTPEMLRSNQHAGLDLVVHHLRHRPRSRVMGGRLFMLGGSTALVEEAPGVQSGDISGIAINQIPWWGHAFYFPPPALARLTDWEEKVARLAVRSLEKDIRLFGGTPSWVLLFCEALATLRQGSTRFAELYPNLELLVHGGVNFAPYRPRFESLLDGSHAELREVYPASEGFFAVADRGEGEGLRLILDHGIFYEFVPVAELDKAVPTRHWMGDIETGIDYALLVSTCAGAWAYLVGDTVRFVERRPPRLLVTGRTTYTLSAFGEHLIDAEIEEAVAVAADAIGADVTDYSVGPAYPQNPGELGGHLFIVEFAVAVTDRARLATFSRALDAALSATNADYEAHRSGDYGLDAPVVTAVDPGTFAAWMKRRGRLGGQHKVPRIINDQPLLDDLRGFVKARGHR